MRSSAAHCGTSRRHVLQTIAGIGVGIAVGSAAHGALYGRYAVGITRAQFPVRDLPPALEGLRIGVLTDTHHGPFTDRPLIDTAVAMLAEERPDLIVLGGDYVTLQDRRFVQASADAFQGLHAPHGVFAVLGNHDEPTLLPKALRRHGIAVLRDARTRLEVKGERLDLLGLDYWTRRRGPIEALARGRAPLTLLLAHDPRRIREASDLRIPAVISGHTHGGQVVLPGLGAIAARKFPIAEGLLQADGTSLFVSRGVGTVYVPCRINCPPEVVVLTLQTAT